MATRDVIFKLRVEDEARNKDVLSKFAAEHAKVQKRIEEAGVNGAKRAGEERTRTLTRTLTEEQKKEKAQADWLNKLRINSAVLEQKESLRALEKEIADRKRRETDFLQWRQRVRANSLKLEQQDAIRIRKEEERALATELRDSMRRNRAQMAAERRGDAITNRLIKGGVGAIGSVGGFIGGDTGSRLMNVAAGGMYAQGAYEGYKGIAGAAGSALRPGLLAGSNAAVAAGTPAVAAGAAALIAWLPALAMAVKGAAVSIQGSESTARVFDAKGKRTGASANAAFGEGIAGSSLNLMNWGARGMTTAQLREASSGPRAEINPDSMLPGSGGGFADYAGLELSKRQLTSQQAANQAQASQRQRQLFLSQQLGGVRRDKDWNVGSFTAATMGGSDIAGRSRLLSKETLTGARQQLAEIRRGYGESSLREQSGLAAARSGRAGLYEQMGQAGEQFRMAGNDPQLRADAAQRVLAVQKEILNSVREEQQITMQGSRDRLSSAKEEYQLKKQLADEAKRSYQSDAAKFALASPEEQARLRGISQKMRFGGDLTKEELQSAQGYDYFNQFSQQQAEKMAEQAGAGDVFVGAKMEKDRLAKEAADAKGRVQKAQVEVDQLYKVEVTLKSDEALSQSVLKEFVPLLKELDDREKGLQEKWRKDFEDSLRRLRGNTKTPGI